MSTATIHPPARPAIGRSAPGAYSAMVAFDRAIEFDPALRELIKVRASQVNGCAFCIDMHTRTALERGESPQRLYALAAWPESPLFTARERAALAVTDAVTHISRDGLPEDVYAATQTEFDDAELAQLILAAVAINAWNRIAISGHMVIDEPWPEDLSG
jgi:AhpD family alkylhydroperoxidase